MENNKKWSDEWSTISVKYETKKRMKVFGSFEENWDTLLNRLVDFFEKNNGK